MFVDHVQSLDDVDDSLMLESMMDLIGRKAKAASHILANASSAQKNEALLACAKAVRAQKGLILQANEKDLALMREKALAASYQERATLNDGRIEAIAVALEDIAQLDDPVGQVLSKWERPNGLNIERVRTPLGVIGVIYESRPNVTVDAGALALKAGNAAILRGGSDTLETNMALYQCFVKGLREAGLPEETVQLVPVKDREAVGFMLSGLSQSIDVIVPRGGKSLVKRVQHEARVPVFAHLEGICHLYIDKDANEAMAKEVVLNAKMRRTSICGAVETLLVDQACAKHMVPVLCQALAEKECIILGDEAVGLLYPQALLASDEDWRTEYLDARLSVRIVNGVEAAIEHIERYGSHHTDGIITDNVQAAETFLQKVDSAIVMHNTSTQFADGGEFGMGAEIGIATGRMHARGPVGVEQLTSFKYKVRSAGKIRP